MSGGKAGLGTHYRRYVTGSVMATLAGLVSFPIMTRLLDNAEYGIFGYYGTWILMAIAVGKLGAQHAIQRFYPHGGDPRSWSHSRPTCSTCRWRCRSRLGRRLPAAGRLGLGVGAGAVGSVLDRAGVAPIYVFTSLTETVMRVTEDSHQVMVTRVVWRWLELVFILGAVYYVQRSALAAYGGKLRSPC